MSALPAVSYRCDDQEQFSRLFIEGNLPRFGESGFDYVEMKSVNQTRRTPIVTSAKLSMFNVRQGNGEITSLIQFLAANTEYFAIKYCKDSSNPIIDNSLTFAILQKY